MIFNEHVNEVLAKVPAELVIHMQLVVVSALLAVIVGIPLGIISTYSPKFERIIMPIINLTQTIPSLAFFGLLVPLAIFGLGFKTAVFVLFIYSLLPIITNTFVGIKDIDPSIIEAATGIGLSKNNILTKVKLRIAFPTIFGGVRMSIVRNVGTATLASYIGAGGLGDLIFLGISNNDTAYLVIGAIATSALALILDIILNTAESKIYHQQFSMKDKIFYSAAVLILVVIPLVKLVITLF